MQAPLLSIVIANYNYGRFLEEAIQSVLSQSCQDFELIVCDAASKDNSVEVIRKYADRITWWCSEPDGGQSAAFNKGFSHANGRFLTWLNADDVMLPGTVESLRKSAARHPECEWFVGGVLWLDPQMRVLNCGRGRPFSEIRYREGNVSVWGPSSFFSKRLLDSVGGVDERFHYMMDTDLWLRFAAQLNARYRPFAHYAWGLRLHPEAKMSGHNFNPGGTLRLKNRAENEVKDKRQMQIECETVWKAERLRARPATRLSRFLSASWISVILAKMDLLRWRGCHYLEVVK